jgi:hypothetical protein
MLTSRGHCTSNSEILESLLELFLDSIITLDLKFLKFFTLPSQTIKAIGQIENLENLQLHPQSLFIPSELAEANRTSASFNLLMMEAQGLKSLHLLIPVWLPCEPNLMTGSQYPAITFLEVQVNTDMDLDVIIGILIALKPSIKHLSLHNFLSQTDAQPLLPIYETLGENLEGLSVTDTSSLSSILHLSFPKLRVLVICSRLGSFPDLLSHGFFSHAPIETLAINCFSADETPRAKVISRMISFQICLN